MARCRPGDKPLSEPMMVSLLTHICVTRPKWVIYEISLTYCSILIPELSNSPRVHQAWRTLGSTGGAYQGQKRGAERKLKHSFVTSEKDYGIFAVVGTLRIVYCYSSKGGLTCHNAPYGYSNQQPLDCLLNCFSRRRSKKTSTLRVTGLCEGNLPATGEFPSQWASNAENVSIWWRHHLLTLCWNISRESASALG